MDHNEMAVVISDWFARAEFADLMVPYGWYGGRFGEVLQALTWIAARPHKLIIELDEEFYVVLTDVRQIRADKWELHLEGFTQLTIDRQFKHDIKPKVQVFEEGTLMFASQDYATRPALNMANDESLS